jgi:hypothetical protein
MQIERWLIGHAHEQATHQIDPRTLRRDAVNLVKISPVSPARYSPHAWTSLNSWAPRCFERVTGQGKQENPKTEILCDLCALLFNSKIWPCS